MPRKDSEMAITENIAKWELGQQGFDPEAEYLKQAFSYMPNEGLADQGEWEGFLNAIDEALQEKAAEDNGGNLPDNFTLPDWRDYGTVLSDCPEEIKSGELPLLAPPDVHAPPPPGTLFAEPPVMENTNPAGFEEVQHPPIENPINHEEERFSEPEDQPEEKSGWGTRLAALVTFALMVGFLFLAWNQGWFSEYDNKDQANTEKADDSDSKDDKVVINDPTDSTKEKSETPAPPPVVTAPPQPEKQPTPTDKGNTIKVVCDVSHKLVSACSDVPKDCTVDSGLWPHIRATCGTETYCSQHGGPAAGGRGKNAELTLKKDWCKSS